MFALVRSSDGLEWLPLQLRIEFPETCLNAEVLRGDT